MADDKKVFLLDAFALIFRAYYALIRSPRNTSKGKNTNAQFGFTNALIELITKQKPSHMAVCFDTAAPTERHTDFAEYKANRQEAPEDLLLAIPDIKRIIKGFNIPVIEYDGYEADDVIATIANKGRLHHQDAINVSTDKGYLPLLPQGVQIYDAFARHFLDTEYVKQKFGVAPEQLLSWWALVGDSTNNIPGVTGVGPKSAEELMQLGASLNQALQHPDCPKKLRQKILEQKQDILVYIQVLALQTNLELGLNLQDIRLPEQEA